MKRAILFFTLIFITLGLYSQEISFPYDTVKIDEVIVTSSYSAAKTTPFTFQNLTQQDISLRAKHVEPHVLFNTTPSFLFSSDSGTGLGYMYFRLRGIDQTRINSTFNGVPLNEPEDQGIFYSNYPGLLNSVSSVQIIRGAGISKPGISSYGGSINFEPLKFADKLSGFAEYGFGSYNTFTFGGGVNSPNAFLNLYSVETDGYRDHVYNNSVSLFYGAKYDFKAHEFKFYGFVGHQKNGMGWMGELLDSIYINPRKNSQLEHEEDKFNQIHNQFVWKWKGFTTTTYYTYLRGGFWTDGIHYWYEGIDTTNFKSDWIGLNTNYFLDINKKIYINTGVNTYMYKRTHFGDSTFYYYNNGIKNSVTPYIKAEFKLKNFTLYGDISYRYAIFKYEGDQPFDDKKYNFLNWSAGVNYKVNDNTRLYYGIGKTFKEPKRYDYFGGVEYFVPEYYVDLVPEKLLSNELGVRHTDKRFIGNINLYYMRFKDEMSLTGYLGYNAAQLSNINIDKSFRSGIEIDSRYKFDNGIEFNTASVVSYNRITEGDFIGKPVATPFAIINLGAAYYAKIYHVGISWRYNSESYIDFYNKYKLPSYNSLNMYAGISWKSLEIKGYFNNITNNLILGSAYMYWDGYPRYFAMAGRNFIISFKFLF